jgi:hypothetical protein
MWHEMLSGRAENALALLDEGIELAAGNPRRRAQLRYARARVLGELGRFEEVDAAIDEVAETARRWGDGWLNGYLAWERMRLASWRADADGVRRHLAAVPEIVERDGERLVLGSGAHSDLSAFMADASTALHRAQNDAVAAAQLAGAVIDRYRGSLLPFDRYEPWTIALRERALAAMLAPDRWRGARRDTGGTARCRHCDATVTPARNDPHRRGRTGPRPSEKPNGETCSRSSSPLSPRWQPPPHSPSRPRAPSTR